MTLNLDSNFRISSFLKSLSVEVIILDSDFKIIELSSKVPILRGASAQLALGKSIEKFVTPEVFKYIKNEFPRLLTQSISNTRTVMHFEQNHGRVTYEIETRAFEDTQVRPAAYVCTFKDISYLDQVNETLRAAEKFGRLIDWYLLTATNETDIIDYCLKLLCEVYQGEFSSFWAVKKREHKVGMVQFFSKTPADHASFISQSSQLTFDVGTGLPGRVMESRTAIWHDVENNSNFPRKASALISKLKFGLAFPLATTDEVVGVLEVFSKDSLSRDSILSNEMIVVLTRVANVIERMRSRLKMTESSRLSSLGEMAGGLAHEINNPLTIISGIAGRIKRKFLNTGVDAAVIKDLEKIESTTTRIARIVKGLRNISRASENDAMITVSLSDVLLDCLELCQTRFKVHGVQLRLGGETNLEIECRGSQISQVLLNLLNNAFDAVEKSPNPWVELMVSKAEDKIYIEIKDSGSGISPDILKKIMTPFFSTKEAGKGSGLGLSISKAIVEAHGGTLTYDPECSNTKFVVELPVKQRVSDLRAA